ncbi:MAG: NusG domain II-containing protein [Selenomonadaceae bacterium]|nr:NusG domain II-containing protein [Selenomonadaceae bacterium]
MIQLKKGDCILILLLLLLGLLPLLILSNRQELLYAHITVNGTTERVVELSGNQYEEFDVTTKKGSNSIRVEKGTVSVYSADCPDHICVNTPPISKPGEIIACLPHKLLIEIKPSAGR